MAFITILFTASGVHESPCLFICSSYVCEYVFLISFGVSVLLVVASLVCAVVFRLQYNHLFLKIKKFQQQQIPRSVCSAAAHEQEEHIYEEVSNVEGFQDRSQDYCHDSENSVYEDNA
ncbi:uncharacterized protein [Penaeus vannamei]|uniref:uncharacterized protein n=1 Tax=Penaeus vannamei TaxID=6689 RepID=UPI00387F77AC